MHLTNDSAQISKQCIAEFRLDQMPAPASREDEMQQDVPGRMRHCSFAPPGLARRSTADDPRLTAWAAFFSRFAAASMPSLVFVLSATEPHRQLFAFSRRHESESGDPCHKCVRGSLNRESQRRSKRRPSSEGAKECSPRRKPWVAEQMTTQPRRGEREMTWRSSQPRRHQTSKLPPFSNSLLRFSLFICYKQ